VPSPSCIGTAESDSRTAAGADSCVGSADPQELTDPSGSDRPLTAAVARKAAGRLPAAGGTAAAASRRSPAAGGGSVSSLQASRRALGSEGSSSSRNGSNTTRIKPGSPIAARGGVSGAAAPSRLNGSNSNSKPMADECLRSLPQQQEHQKQQQREASSQAAICAERADIGGVQKSEPLPAAAAPSSPPPVECVKPVAQSVLQVVDSAADRLVVAADVPMSSSPIAAATSSMAKANEAAEATGNVDPEIVSTAAAGVGSCAGVGKCLTKTEMLLARRQRLQQKSLAAVCD